MKIWVCMHGWCDDVTATKVVDSAEKAAAWKSAADAEISDENKDYSWNSYEVYEVE